MYPTPGKDSTPETLRGTVEKGGGRDNCGEERMKSLSVATASSVSSWMRTVEKPSTKGSGMVKDIPEVTLELCKELPRSSSCKLRSSDGRGIPSSVDLEDTRSCS